MMSCARALALATLVTATLLDQASAQQQRCSYNGRFNLKALRPGASARGSKGRVFLIGTSNIRCTEAARSRLEGAAACFTFVETRTDPDLFNYMRCIHPETNMHSWVYFNGEYVGDGFRLLSNSQDSRCIRPGFQRVGGGAGSVALRGMTAQCYGRSEFNAKLASAAVNTVCPKDCSHIVDDQLPARFPGPFEGTIKHAPLVLYGWSGCPCTSFARNHFQANSYCYQEDVWPTSHDQFFKYLQCRYGAQHHSFIFLQGQFMGNGFSFNTQDPYAEFGDEKKWHALAVKAGARQTCPFRGLQNLLGGKLKSCTTKNDRMNTGWTRSGSCNWDANDGGYHEVCVEMTQEFLDISANVDGNDLSRVVSKGGHWCICAWAFASAVARSKPKDLAAGKPEGIKLECEATNGKLRDVYSHYAALQSPTAHSYLSRPALALADRLCPDASKIKVAGQTVTVTRDESKSGQDPCYVLKGNSVQFPAFEPVCPGLSPLPTICGNSATDVATAKCAAPYTKWYNKCGKDAFVAQLDKQLQGAFGKFGSMCQAAMH